jgi:ribosomal protein L34E
MDGTTLSAEIIDELGQLFVETLRRNAAALVKSDLDTIEQQLQVMSREVMGRVVEQVVAAIAGARSEEKPRCPECGQPMRRVDAARPRQLQGLVGDYRIERAYYLCTACHQGYYPVDERLGIGIGALSPGLERVACRLGINETFGEASDALYETLKVAICPEAIRRATEGIGAVVEVESQAAVKLVEAGREPLSTQDISAKSSIVLVEVDGSMVHEVDGQWHEAKSGLVAPLGPKVQIDRETGREMLAMGSPYYCAGFENAEAFWYRVYVEACRQGLGTNQVGLVVLLADGAEWIWHYGHRFLAVEVGNKRVEVIEIVDIFHAFEHLGTIAGAVFGQASEAAKQWVEPLKRDLRTRGASPILAALRSLNSTDPNAAEEVRKGIGYFTEHAARMDYPTFVARGLPIGSGAVESTCKVLIEQREKGAGMRWTENGAQTVASLRAIYRSGRWSPFWRTHPQMRRPRVSPIPSTVSPTDNRLAKSAA